MSQRFNVMMFEDIAAFESAIRIIGPFAPAIGRNRTEGDAR